MKILYFLSNIIPLGGVEFVTCTKVNALSQVAGNEIWLAVTENPETLPFRLAREVHLVSLNIRYKDNNRPFPWNLLAIHQKKRQHKKAMASLLHEVQPDIVVSISNEVSFLTTIKGPWKLVREQHAVRKWDLRPTPSGGLNGIVFKLASNREHRILGKKFDRLVVLTRKQQEIDWPGNPKAAVIPNPIRFHVDTPSPLNEHRAMAVGRLSYEKHFTSLVRTWALVAPRCPGWKLDIYGDGEQYQAIQDEIDKNGLAGIVSLKGPSSRIETELVSSSLFILTSRYESFSMACIEALGCGLPVVSYDCPFGPGAIVEDGRNGYLVPPGNEAALADRICRLIQDDALRKRMGANAFDSARQYSLPSIIDQWMTLFKGLLSE